MKKWKKCPLLIVTAISMLLVSGVALAGTKGAYKEYNKDWYEGSGGGWNDAGIQRGHSAMG